MNAAGRRSEKTLSESRFCGHVWMMTEDDMTLVREFAARQSEPAFAALVERHLGLVHSAALRQAGDPELAGEIAQSVFILLARKAATLGPGTILPAWLYRATRHAAADALRARRRRFAREQEAYMQSHLDQPPNDPGASSDPWRQMAPLLDDALAQLGETDRAALVLRYFENKSAREIAGSLRLAEAAAQKRVARALEKLRKYFAQRGLTLTTAAIATAVAAHGVQAAPAGLALVVKTASLTAAGTGTLGFLQIMNLIKLKLSLGALVVAGAVTAIVVQHQAQLKLRGENESLLRQMAQLQTDNNTLSNRLATAAPAALPVAEEQELLKLRGEVGVLQRQLGDRKQLQVENQRLKTEVTARPAQPSQITPEDLFRIQSWHFVDAMKQAGIAERIYANNHQGQYPASFAQMVDDQDVKSNGFAGNIPLDAVEMVNPGKINAEQYPQMIVLRERFPRHNPDGGWEREYGLADGSVQTEESPDGNFDAYEQQQQQFGPPANQ